MSRGFFCLFTAPEILPQIQAGFRVGGIIGEGQIAGAFCRDVGFRKPGDWEKVYLYSWNDGGATKYTGDWPGSEMTEMNDHGIYTHQFDAAVKEVNFIFNNGSGTQTADLWTDEDVCYGWEASKAVKIDCSGTDVENVPTVTTPMLDITRPMYNILGQKVGASYHGIVIQNGHKYLK